VSYGGCGYCFILVKLGVLSLPVRCLSACDAQAGTQTGGYLSGGEKQKLLIEMLPEADVYLLDEPAIGLDKGSIEKLAELIKQMIEKGKTLLITVPEYRDRVLTN
jgi:ABC-type multidrug transport system ATPase subunit